MLKPIITTRYRVELWRPANTDRLSYPHWHHIGLFRERKEAEACAQALRPGRTQITEEKGRR